MAFTFSISQVQELEALKASGAYAEAYRKIYEWSSVTASDGSAARYRAG